MTSEDLGQKGEFRLLSKIGEGGMADVFLAERMGDDGFRTRVALKRLHQGLAMDSYFIRQLVREARLLGQLEHANIVRVFDLRRIGDEYFVVMEYVDGIDLAAVIKVHRQRRTRVPLPFFFHVALSLLESLSYAHAAVDENGNPTPLIHRDIKPSNVMLSRRGVVKLTDFGIAHVGDGSVTGGMVQGTANYMSPEQAHGDEHLTPASDIYSLGVVFFEMLCGRPLVQGDNYLKAIQQVREQVVSSEDLEKLGVKPGLRMVVARMLARDRAGRYAEPDLVRNDLQFVADRLEVNLNWHRIRSYVGRLMGILGRAPSRATLSNLSVDELAGDAVQGLNSHTPQPSLPTPSEVDGRPTTPTTAAVRNSSQSAADVTAAVRKDLLDLQLSSPGLAENTEAAAPEPDLDEDSDEEEERPAAVVAAEEDDSGDAEEDDSGDAEEDDSGDAELELEDPTTASDTAAPLLPSPLTGPNADWIEDDETAVYTGELPDLPGAAAPSAPGGSAPAAESFGSFEENTDERTVPFVATGSDPAESARPPERINPPSRQSGSFPPAPPSLTAEFGALKRPPKPSPAVAFLPEATEAGPTGTQVLAGEEPDSQEDKTWVLSGPDAQEVALARSAPHQTQSDVKQGGASAAAPPVPAGRASGQRPAPRRKKRRRKKGRGRSTLLGMDKRTVLLAALFSMLIAGLVFVIAIVVFVKFMTEAPAQRVNPVFAEVVAHEDPVPLQFRTDLGILPRDLCGSPALSLHHPPAVCCLPEPGEMAT